jgi:hypothetical protein
VGQDDRFGQDPGARFDDGEEFHVPGVLPRFDARGRAR